MASYNLLARGIEGYLQSVPAEEAVQAVADRLSLDWYVGVLSRLHINSVRCATRHEGFGFYYSCRYCLAAAATHQVSQVCKEAWRGIGFQ